MSFKRIVAVAAAAVGLGATAGALLYAQGGSNSSVVGAWKVAERSYEGANPRKITNPQPGVWLFTRRHYSFTDDTSDNGRPTFPAEGATAQQRADVFGPFTAQAGTYEINGSEITFKRIAAKNPNNLRPGRFTTWTFRLEGSNTLWATQKANQDGPLANQMTLKLTRLE
jgi:hypothetical protein